jgi:guanine nucleotide-binding protein G(i) subunit alpha
LAAAGQFTQEQKNKYKGMIISNILSSIVHLVKASKDLEMPFSNPEVDEVTKELNHILEHKELWNEVTAEKVQEIWQDSDAQRMLAYRNVIQLQETIDYFMDHVDTIGKANYEPTIGDILRSKMKTTGIVDKKFRIGGRQIMITDTGGQKNERKSM